MEAIRQHKMLAEGKSVDVGGGDCCYAFGATSMHGGEGLSKKKHVKDGARGLKPGNKHADHGEHGMGTPNDGKYSD